MGGCWRSREKFMKRMLLLSAALIMAACGQQPASAPQQQAETAPVAPEPPVAPVTPMQPAVSPAEFVQKVANSDAFEIQSGQLAAQRASRAEVKQFGRMLITDHQTT